MQQYDEFHNIFDNFFNIRSNMQEKLIKLIRQSLIKGKRCSMFFENIKKNFFGGCAQNLQQFGINQTTNQNRYNYYIMARAIPKRKIKRTSSMQRTIDEAKDFLAVKSKTKRITKNRTILQTIQQSKKQVFAPKIRKITKPKATTVKSKPQKKPTKPQKRPTKPQKRQRKSQKTPTRSARKPSPAQLAMAASKNKQPKKPIKNEKQKQIANSTNKTVFKTKSKDKLPLPAFGYIDVCFCVDATGSMTSQLQQVQKTIVAIIKKIQTKVATEGISLRFAVVTYRDHPPQQVSYVTQCKDFTSDVEIIEYVNKLKADGGGDEPQAVHDGLLDCAQKLNWAEIPGTPTLRYIFHIADAPPHGKQFVTHEAQEGCTCGKQTKDVIRAINIKQIHYRLIKVRTNPRVDEMEKIFKKDIGNFDSALISNAAQMDIRVSDMIIHQILPDYA